MKGFAAREGAIVKEPSDQPVISLERFMEAFLASETEIAMKEFTKIWSSSEGTRLAIRSFLKHRENQAQPKTTEPPLDEAQAPFSNVRPTERLIAECLVSASEITDNLRTSYGGLSKSEILLLLDKHKAGNRNLGVYLLVRAWKRSGRVSAPASTRLEQLTLRSVANAIKRNKGDFFRELADALDFLRKEEYEENGIWDHDPGQWWQFHLLLYVFEHPKEKYRIRELIKHFRDEVGTNEMPTSKTIRKFCRGNGIALDSRPGAPKKSPK